MIIFVVAVSFAIVGIAYLKYRLINTSDKNNLESSIDAEVQKTIKRDLFPGIVVGVYKGGHTFIKGYGTVNKEISQPPDSETVFQIGSVSKVLTAMILQRLCDEGAVSMDSTLGELLGNSMPLYPSVQGVTLQQLVTHSSGFPRVPKLLLDKITELAGNEDVMTDPYSYLDPQDIFDYLASADGKRKAGQFAYSNYGMGLLAHVLEIVTGEDYESLVKEKVLQSINLKNTTITFTPVMKERLAQGYTAKGEKTPIWTFSALGGAGAFSSTAGDMMTFIQESLADSGMASQLFKNMCQSHLSGKTGIGWMQPSFIDRFVGNRGAVWHNGMVGGYASYLSIDKKSGTGVVVLTNQASTPDMLGMMLMRQARTQSWSSHEPSNKSMQSTANASAD